MKIRPVVVPLLIAVWPWGAGMDLGPASAECQEPPALPAESDLPSTKRNEPLPPESELPQPGQTQVADQGSSPDAHAEVPGENELPGSGQADGPDRTDEGTTDPLADSDHRFRFRVDYPGHTSRIRDLLYLPDPDRLISVGEDKIVHVWRRNPRQQSDWVHQRVIRWQVARGDSGRIYCVAAHQHQVAIAGNGALSGNGEIIVADAVTGKQVRPLNRTIDGHDQVVAGLDWSGPADRRNGAVPETIASADLDGRTMIWQPDRATGLWNGKIVRHRDTQTLGEAVAKRLVRFRRFVPVTFRGPTELLYPELDGFKPNKRKQELPIWKVVRLDTHSGKQQAIDGLRLPIFSRLLHASDDATLLAAAGYGTKVSVVQFKPTGSVEKISLIDVDAQPSFVDFFELTDPAGNDAPKRMMVVGTDKVVQQHDGEHVAFDVSWLQTWEIQPEGLKFVSFASVPGTIHCGDFDPIGRSIVVAADSALHVYPVNQNGSLAKQPRQKLVADASPVETVAFAKDQHYRVAFKRAVSNNTASYDGVFNLSEVRLHREARIDDDDFLPSQRLADKWDYDLAQNGADGRYVLRRIPPGQAPQPVGTLPLIDIEHGVPTTISTTSDVPGQQAVAIGTSGRGNIFLYSTEPSDPLRLIRQFRGHESTVRSLSVSDDGQYLVSGADDSTMMVWNLQDAFTCGESINRWGVAFEIDDGELIAADVREDGPLYFRGVRRGDRLTGISWRNQSSNVDAADPQQMIRQLDSVTFDTLVTFRFSRLGRPLTTLNSYPAWHPLAALLVDNDREWVFWTPAGYYDASFNGHHRFGWQINRGLERAPDFFRAARFREALERPRVMKGLLRHGSLPTAMRRSLSRIEPPPGESAIANQYLTRPRITITSPQPGQAVVGSSLEVTVDIEVPSGSQLVPPKAFVSGVPATKIVPVENKDGQAANNSRAIEQFEISFTVPDDPELLLEIVAATDSKASDRATMILPHTEIAPADRRPQLHVLAIGVSDYRDPQIGSLDFPAQATKAVSDAFRVHSESLYRVTSDRLVNDDAVRPLWNIYAQDAYERLQKSVSPNDLVVMYLCGHGYRSRRTNQWYFVTADAEYSDLMNDQFGECLSFEDLALLAELPCRKLAILDSCHSGAVQPLMQNDDLKTALRLLQNDVVITLTASEGDEEAAEDREAGLGRFTNSLVAAVSGKADADADNQVTLREVIDYVVETVSAAADTGGVKQHPTASPAYLTDRLEVPIARIKQP